MRQVKLFQQLGSSYNQILFLGEARVGFLILASSFLYPNIALSGLLALLSALFISKLLKTEGHYLVRNALLCNSLLVGLYIGYLFHLDVLVVCLILFSSCLTFLLVYFLNSIFYSQSLPLLSLPFTLMAVLLALAAPTFTNLADGSSYFIPHSLSALQKVFGIASSSVTSNSAEELFRSTGAIFCIPDPLFGLIIMAVILFHSPLTAILIGLGYLLGATAESYLTFSGSNSVFNHHTFNYSLLFASIAGAFLPPSRRSLVWATLATISSVLVASALMVFWQYFKVPITALPFNIIALLLLRALKTIDPFQLAAFSMPTPEMALERAGLLWMRHRSPEVGVFCPIEGECLIQQGFQGEWTHQGNWKHALDFVIQGKDGKTFRNHGVELSDYLIYEHPVVAPVSGQIVDLCSGLADNPIGKVENQQNWGNYVTIRASSGVHVSLAHLKKDSIKVATGEFITVGKEIALCGNSGYSQEPHLHLQVQLSQDMGSPTLAFHLLNYRSGQRGVFHGIPRTGEKVAAFDFNAILDRLLTFRMGEVLSWKCNGSIIQLTHSLDPATGIPYWTDGRSRLFYSRVGAQFYFYGLDSKTWSPLCDFFLACPRIPITFGEEIHFEDYFPLSLTHSFLPRFVILLRQLVSSQIRLAPARYILDPTRLELRGLVRLKGITTKTFCKIDPMSGFSEFQVGERRYVRAE